MMGWGEVNYGVCVVVVVVVGGLGIDVNYGGFGQCVAVHGVSSLPWPVILPVEGRRSPDPRLFFV